MLFIYHKISFLFSQKYKSSPILEINQLNSCLLLILLRKRFKVKSSAYLKKKQIKQILIYLLNSFKLEQHFKTSLHCCVCWKMSNVVCSWLFFSQITFYFKFDPLPESQLHVANQCLFFYLFIQSNSMNVWYFK